MHLQIGIAHATLSHGLRGLLTFPLTYPPTLVRWGILFRRVDKMLRWLAAVPGNVASPKKPVARRACDGQ